MAISDGFEEQCRLQTTNSTTQTHKLTFSAPVYVCVCVWTLNAVDSVDFLPYLYHFDSYSEKLEMK